MQTEMLALHDYFVIELHGSCFAGDGRVWKVNGRAQAPVGSGLATSLSSGVTSLNLMLGTQFNNTPCKV